MSTKSKGGPSRRRDGLWVLIVFVGVAVASFGSGCSRSEAAPARHTSTKESAAVTAGAKADRDTYVAEIIADGAYKAGAEGTVKVVLTPKNGHHTNAQYPYKFKLDAPADGVTYPKPLLQRADGVFDETRGQFNVPFTAAKSGTVTIAGTLSLSVCNDAHCIIEKEPLEVQVDVK